MQSTGDPCQKVCNLRFQVFRPSASCSAESFVVCTKCSPYYCGFLEKGSGFVAKDQLTGGRAKFSIDETSRQVRVLTLSRHR